MTGRILAGGLIGLLVATTLLAQRQFQDPIPSNQAKVPSSSEPRDRTSDTKKAGEWHLSTGASKLMNLLGDARRDLRLASSAAKDDR